MATNTTTPARWLVALLAVLALGLSGCVIQQADGDPDAGDKPGTEHTDHGDGEDKDNGKDKKKEKKKDEDEGKESDDQAEDDDTSDDGDDADSDDGDGTKINKIDLEAGEDKLYLAPQQPSGFLAPSGVPLGQPWVSVWRITPDKKVTLSETKCNAGVVVEATGEIVEDGKDTAGGDLPLSIKWDTGEDPWVGDAPAEYTGIEFTDDDQALEVAVAATEQATTDVEGQAKSFVKMCEKSSAKVSDRWKQAAGEAEDDANDAEDTDDKEN